MASEEIAKLTAELEATQKALKVAREELELAKDRENKLFNSLKAQGNPLSETSERGPDARRSADYLVLLAIVALAGWQVYLTVQLQRLM